MEVDDACARLRSSELARLTGSGVWIPADPCGSLRSLRNAETAAAIVLLLPKLSAHHAPQIPTSLSLELARVFACLISRHHLFSLSFRVFTQPWCPDEVHGALARVGFLVEEWFSASAERGEKGGEGLEIGLDWICL